MILLAATRAAIASSVCKHGLTMRAWPAGPRAAAASSMLPIRPYVREAIERGQQIGYDKHGLVMKTIPIAPFRQEFCMTFSLNQVLTHVSQLEICLDLVFT